MYFQYSKLNAVKQKHILENEKPQQKKMKNRWECIYLICYFKQNKLILITIISHQTTISIVQLDSEQPTHKLVPLMVNSSSQSLPRYLSSIAVT